MSVPTQPYPQASYQQAPVASCPSPNWAWMIIAIICFWPLAIASGINASRVQSLCAAGDTAGAQKASADAKKFGRIALIIGIAIVALGVVAGVLGALA
ncbi:MAG: CD225/dispanin family protein [Actinomycetia bacterium]|nr:CD225/dispanin family protein [Actinomycetes bacterium]